MQSGSRFRPTPEKFWRAWGTGSAMRSRPTTWPRSWSAHRVSGERRSAEADTTAPTIRDVALDWRWGIRGTPTLRVVPASEPGPIITGGSDGAIAVKQYL